MPVDWPVAALLFLAAGLAGWVDAVAGGGGILQLPSVLAAGIHQPIASGVNKTSSLSGTVAALVRYARHGQVAWATVPACGLLCVLGSAVGSLGLIQLAEAVETAVVPFFAACFVALAVHQVLRVLRHREGAPLPRRRPVLGLLLCLLIGLYDGLIGPGTGIFLFWTLSTCFALHPLRATGTTKALNMLTNMGALVPLLLRGHTLWPLALGMASCNVLGGTLGSHHALTRGTGLVRIVAALVSVGASVLLLVRWAHG
ncbi:MAG: sulfite exporter TauE/SafE family protein [Planctomycetia bacterium]